MTDARAARDRLLQSISSLSVSDASGTLLVFGDASVIVAADIDDQPEALVAAASWAQGRVVAFGHSEMLEPDDDGDDDSSGKTRLIRNAIAWAAGKKSKPRVLVNQSSELAESLEALGYTVIDHDEPYATHSAGAHDVAVIGDVALSSDDRAAIEAFVTGGGGLLIAMTGWTHPHYGPKENGRVVALGHSLLLAQAGIIWDESTTMPGDGDEQVEVEIDSDRADAAHVGSAVQTLVEWLGDDSLVSEDSQELARVVRAGVRSLRYGTRFGADTRELGDAIESAFAEVEDDITPRVDRPVAADAAWPRALIALQTERWRALAPDEVTACSAAEAYPGAVAEDAEFEDAEVHVDATVAQWVSTGRYAKPGSVVEISLDAKALARGLRVRIGAHIDELYTDDDRQSGVADDADWGSDESEWKRWPELSFEFALSERKTRVASPFGGLVYVIVPDDGEGEFTVTVRGAVRAPRFVLGSSSVHAWRESERDAPAPWGELESDRLILTMPSSALRSLDDPEAVLRVWNRVIQCYEEITGHEYRRAERIVADCQPSLGYMHSGYPIVAWLDDEDTGLLSVLDARKVITDGVWGPMHELAHNVQSDAWTFEHTDEVTNNVLVLYAMNVVCGFAPSANPALDDARKGPRKKLDAWDDDPFSGLLFFAEIQRSFGWQPFIDVFAEYRALAEDQQPTSDEDKRDQWVLRLSKRVEHNLAPHFHHWGIETSAAAQRALRDLPSWSPPAHESPRKKKR